MKYFCSVLALILLLAITMTTAEARQRQRPLECPKVLTAAGTLLIALGPRHGDEFAIIRKADDARFVLVSKQMTPEMPQIMAPEDFAKTVMYQMQPDTEWFAWGGNGESQRIFNAAGQYQVVVGKDATSDKGGHRCTITYTD